MPYTHDGENHLARFANYYLALKEGQLPPRWAPNLMNRYGYPVFNYNYPLANILSLPGTILNVNLETTFKILITITLILGGSGSWLWLGSLSYSKTAQVLALLSYLSAPYILSAVFFRGSIGEVMVYGLLPWLLWWLGKIKSSPRHFTLIVGGVFIALLLLAHNVTGLIGIAIVGVFAMVEWGTNKIIWQKAIISFLIGIGLSLWFWLPAMLESNQVVLLSAGIQKEFLNHLVTLRQLITSPLTFGFSTAEPVDSLSMGMGAAVIFTLWASLILLLVLRIFGFSRNKQALIVVSLVLIIALLFFQSTYSVWFWSLMSFASIIQFPWRLMLFVPVLILPILAWVWGQGWWTTRTLILIGLSIQIWAAFNLQLVDRFHKPNQDYFAFAQSTSTQNENRPISFTYDNIADWQPEPLVWDGQGSIEVIKWTGSYRQYRVNAETTVFILEPTANFLGWQTRVENVQTGVKTRAHYSYSPVMAGRINYSLALGQYLITTRFTQQTPARYLGNGLFIVTIMIVGFLLIKESKKKKNVH